MVPEINLDVPQGCPLSPSAFNLYLLDGTSRLLNIPETCFIVNSVTFATFLFAENRIIIGESENKLQESIYK
jgi:hypothetical protein